MIDLNHMQMAAPLENIPNNDVYIFDENNPNGYTFFSSTDRNEMKRVMKRCMNLKCKKVKCIQSNVSGMSWRCVEQGCTFFHYSKRGPDGVFSTSKSEPHSCAKLYAPHISSAEAKRHMKQNQLLMTLPPVQSQQQIQALGGGIISYRTLARARSDATQELDYDGMRKVRGYLNKLKASNPGSVCEVEINEDSRLRYLFVCPGSSHNVIRFSLPVLCIDATHSFVSRTHKIYTAVTVDCNNHSSVVCFGIFPQESTESWSVFIQLMKGALELEDIPGLVVFSDRNPGLVRAIHEVLPNTTHSLCAFHLNGNFKQRFGSDRSNIATRLAHCKTQAQYTEIIDSLESQQEREYLRNIPPESFCVFAMADGRFGRVASSVAEGINGAILKLRSYPTLMFVIEMIAFINKGMHKGRDEISRIKRANNGRLPVMNSVTESMLVHNMFDASKYTCRPMAEGLFCINMSPSLFWHVDLMKHTCTCIEFQEMGVPCVHACCAIARECDGRVTDFIIPQQLLVSAENMYQSSVVEVTLNDIDEEGVRPLILEGGQGRRRNRRIPSAGEVIGPKKYKCSFCKREGHTRAKCKELRRIANPEEAQDNMGDDVDV